MKISKEQRKAYIDGLYSVEEQEQIKESLERYSKMQNPQEFKKVFNTAIQDFLLLDEEYRLVKKHLNISKEKISEILKNHRIPSVGEEKMLNILNG